jgi:hypothetical protein
VYEFIQALHNAIDTKKVDYDSRSRISITEENFTYKQEHLHTMVETISNTIENIPITITAKKTYPEFYTITSLQRELLELLEHEKNHQNYVNTTQKENNEQQEYEIYTINTERKISLDNSENIKIDIQQDIKRYQSVLIYNIPSDIQHKYALINNKVQQLEQYNTDNLLIFKDTLTSVSNEYYKIEEELVHLLYDIRLYLKNNHTDIFHKLIEKDHNF